MKTPLIILNKKSYQRRLRNLNEELLIITTQESKALMLLRKELAAEESATFTSAKVLEYTWRRREIRTFAEEQRKSACWWFAWYPVVLNCVLLALLGAVIKFLVLPFIF